MSKLLLGCSGIDARGTSFRRSMQIECEQVIIEVRRACELPVKHSQVRCERSLTKGLTDHYLKMNRTWRPTPRWRDPLLRQCLGRIDSMTLSQAQSLNLL